MRIKFYFDEDVPLSFAQALLNRGVDVITTQAAGNLGISDKEQLQFAIRKSRVLLTHNKKDFIELNKEFAENSIHHCGIVVTDQLPIGTLLRRTMKLWFSVTSEDMDGRLEFLSAWK